MLGGKTFDFPFISIKVGCHLQIAIVNSVLLIEDLSQQDYIIYWFSYLMDFYLFYLFI